MFNLSAFFPGTNVTRSEIHEKMSCIRCQNASGTENMEEGNETNVDDNACQVDQEDIGGFAKDAECFNLLKDSERQVPSCAWLPSRAFSLERKRKTYTETLPTKIHIQHCKYMIPPISSPIPLPATNSVHVLCQLISCEKLLFHE